MRYAPGWSPASPIRRLRDRHELFEVELHSEVDALSVLGTSHQRNSCSSCEEELHRR
jgi:hypothetical protein